MKPDVVMDASALLAWVLAENGGDQAAAMAPLSYVSAMNLAEVVQKLAAMGISEQVLRPMAREFGCTIVPVDEGLGIEAGLLRRETRGRGLSLGDRVCLALAIRLGLPVVTADRAWAGLDLGVEVVLIR